METHTETTNDKTADNSVPMSVTVASLQASSVMGDVHGNVAKFTTLCEEAARNNAKFIVLPETAITGYLSQDLKTNWVIKGRPREFKGQKHPKEHAEKQGGPSVTHFAALAKKLQVYITVPFLEIDTDDLGTDKYYNAISLVDPKGDTVAHYRKTSPWPSPEKSWATKGKEVTPVDTEYGRVGLAICFDIHSVLAKYAPHDIWALLYPIAWVGDPQHWFRCKLPELLRDSNCPHYIIGCNWATDVEYEWQGAGYSTHYGPRGEIHASTGDQFGKSTIIYSTIPTAHKIAKDGTSVGKLNDVRYSVWTETTGGQGSEWCW